MPADRNTPSSAPSVRKPRRLLGLQEVIYLTTLSKPTIYRKLASRDAHGRPGFVVPVRIVGTVLGFHAQEIDEWITSRPRVCSSTPANPEPLPADKSWRLITLNEVRQRTGLGRATVYRMLASRTSDRAFPIPVQVSEGRIAWFEHEIEAWIATRPRRGHQGPGGDQTGGA